MNCMIKLLVRLYLVYIWVVFDVLIVICYILGSQGEDWMNWILNILFNRNYYYLRVLRIFFFFWYLIKWDIGLMLFIFGY